MSGIITMKFEVTTVTMILYVAVFLFLAVATATVVPTEFPYQGLDKASANAKYYGQANRGNSITVIHFTIDSYLLLF